VYKIRIIDQDEMKQQLGTECAKLDQIIIAAAIRQWRCCLSVCVKAGGGALSLTFVILLLMIFFANVFDMNSYPCRPILAYCLFRHSDVVIW